MSELVLDRPGAAAVTGKRSRVFRELNTVLAIFAREVSVAFKSPGTLVMSLAMPAGKLLLILVMSPLECLSAGALAMIFIGFIKNKKVANMAVMLIVMPQMFLSGAIVALTVICLMVGTFFYARSGKNR